jgi:hypothetical protein
MSKIELYLVKSSYGEYEDYRVCNEKIIYASLEAAEKRCKEISIMNEKQPFPFDWCTEQEFDTLREEYKVSDEDLETYDQWYEHIYFSDFIDAWTETIELDQQSWRERQLKKIEI